LGLANLRRKAPLSAIVKPGGRERLGFKLQDKLGVCQARGQGKAGV